MLSPKFFKYGEAIVHVGKQYEILPGVYPALAPDGATYECIGLRDCGNGNFLLRCKRVDSGESHPFINLEPIDLTLWVREVEKVADAN